MKIFFLALIFFILLTAIAYSEAFAAGLIDQINPAFRSVWGRDPNVTEWHYWAGRVVRGEKKSWPDLVGAIAYQKQKSGAKSLVAPLSPLPSAHMAPPWCQPAYSAVR
jgi:hypothetical protein